MPQDGETPLIKATKMRNIEVVELLLDKGAKVSAVDKVGSTGSTLSLQCAGRGSQDGSEWHGGLPLSTLQGASLGQNPYRGPGSALGGTDGGYGWSRVFLLRLCQPFRQLSWFPNKISPNII